MQHKQVLVFHQEGFQLPVHAISLLRNDRKYKYIFMSKEIPGEMHGWHSTMPMCGCSEIAH